MKKILLYNQGTCYNHGCEAIVRTTSAMIGSRFERCQFSVSSMHPEEDTEMMGNFENCRFFASDNYPNEKIRHYYGGSCSTLFRNIPFFGAIYKPTVKAAEEADVIISIGGDNYSYGKGLALTTVDNKLRNKCKKSVLWGCSINPELLDETEHKYKVDGLRKFSLITVRESLTYEALEKLGFDNIKLYPDPAFTLPAGEVREKMFPNDRDIVGINASPLITQFESGDNLTYKNYKQLISKILTETDFNIALISHVICPTTNDSEIAARLKNEFGNTDRIKIFDRGNAVDIKGMIGKCRFFVASRTHASIAAYSQCIPTLVVGYSVKSKGIALDLFGTYDGYVVPVQGLTNENALADTFFNNIVKNENDIKSRLEAIMPDVIARADSAADEIVALLEESHD